MRLDGLALVPVEGLLVEDVPAEELPVEDVPVEDVPLEDVPPEDARVVGVPVDEVEVPVEDALGADAEEVPVEDAPGAIAVAAAVFVAATAAAWLEVLEEEPPPHAVTPMQATVAATASRIGAANGGLLPVVLRWGMELLCRDCRVRIFVVDP